MKELTERTGDRVVAHRPKIVSLTEQKEINKFFDSKSITICKTDGCDTKLIINRKLANKLELDGNTVQVKRFPEMNAIIIGKKLPFNMPMNYATYNSEAVLVEDAQLVDDIIETIGIDFNNCIAKAFRNISYQRVGDSYMATVFLK